MGTMFNAQNFRIEDRGKGWRVYADLPAEAEHGSEICVFTGWVPKTGYAPFDAQACAIGLQDCLDWVKAHE